MILAIIAFNIIYIFIIIKIYKQFQNKLAEYKKHNNILINDRHNLEKKLKNLTYKIITKKTDTDTVTDKDKHVFGNNMVYVS